HAVAHRLPVYTISDTRDATGRIVHYERLLLPLTGDGADVAHVLASLETVSPEGAFDNHGLITATGRSPAFALCTSIVESFLCQCRAAIAYSVAPTRRTRQHAPLSARGFV